MNLKIELKTFEISKIVEYVDVGNTNLNYGTQEKNDNIAL